MTLNANEKKASSRREFLKASGVVATGMYLGGRSTARAADTAASETLAINGGPKTVTKGLGDAGKWPRFEEEEIGGVSEMLRDFNYGPIAKFEEAWKAYFGCNFCKAHVNGTSSLGSAFFALDLPKGSEVLVSSYSTWFPLSPARTLGIVPRFVDIDPKTFNLDVNDCKRHLTKNTRAILPVHWWGLPCELDHVLDFAKEHGLEVIEDCSHAHGSTFKDKFIGNWGRIGAFSLQGTKPLPSSEGGIAMYKNRADFERATTFGNYDLPKTFPADSPYRKYDGAAFGWKLRMHPASAILATAQLKRLEDHNKTISGQVDKLNDRITQLPGLSAPTCRKDMKRVHYNSNLLLFDATKAGMSRDKCVAALQAEGVPVNVYGWPLLHEHVFFQEAKWWEHPIVNPGKLPGCNQANDTAISLSLIRTEQPEMVEQWAKAFEKVWANRDKVGKA